MSRFGLLSAFVSMTMVLHATICQIATDFRFPCGPQDCAEALCWNDRSSLPLLNCPKSEPFFPKANLTSRFAPRLCLHNTLAGSTIVMLRRNTSPSVSFNRSWREYENGFGTYNNHWLGLKHLHRLTSRSKQIVGVLCFDANGNWHSWKYDSFLVDDASSFYKLHLGARKMPVDILKSSREQPFYTYDSNNPTTQRLCGERFRSGWWFGSCSDVRSKFANFNGLHNANDDTGIFALSFPSLRIVEMFFRPFMYNETTYVCDKSCPNGGTCLQSADRTSFSCVCTPAYTGWRCESPVPKSRNVRAAVATANPQLTVRIRGEKPRLTTSTPALATTMPVPWYEDNSNMLAGIAVMVFGGIFVVLTLYAIKLIFCRKPKKEPPSSLRPSYAELEHLLLEQRRRTLTAAAAATRSLDTVVRRGQEHDDLLTDSEHATGKMKRKEDQKNRQNSVVALLSGYSQMDVIPEVHQLISMFDNKPKGKKGKKKKKIKETETVQE